MFRLILKKPKTLIKRFKHTKKKEYCQEKEEKDLERLYKKEFDKEIDYLNYVSKVHATRNG